MSAWRRDVPLNIITTNGTGTITLNGTNSGTTPYGIIASNTTQSDFIQAGGAVALNSSQDISLTKANINFTGTNSPSVTLDTNYSSATPTNGAIALTNSNITTNGGNITLGGGTSPTTTGAVGNITNIVGINLNASTLNAGGGNISLIGTGYAGTTNDFGIELQAAANLITSSNGTITVKGTGGNGTSGNYGVYLTGTSTETITAANGSINIMGTGAGTTTTDYGISHQWRCYGTHYYHIGFYHF